MNYFINKTISLAKKERPLIKEKIKEDFIHQLQTGTSLQLFFRFSPVIKFLFQGKKIKSKKSKCFGGIHLGEFTFYPAREKEFSMQILCK